jgi:hypothetical protein
VTRLARPAHVVDELVIAERGQPMLGKLLEAGQ